MSDLRSLTHEPHRRMFTNFAFPLENIALPCLSLVGILTRYPRLLDDRLAMEAQAPVSPWWPHRSELLRSWSMTSGRHARVFPHGERSCDTCVSGEEGVGSKRWPASHTTRRWWRQKRATCERAVRDTGFDWVGLGKGRICCEPPSALRGRVIGAQAGKKVVCSGGGRRDGWMDPRRNVSRDAAASPLTAVRRRDCGCLVR